MAAVAEAIYEGALQLPPRERADLAVKLFESLDHEVNIESEAAWSAEIARRIGELDSGAVELIPWAQARRILLGLEDAPG